MEKIKKPKIIYIAKSESQEDIIGLRKFFFKDVEFFYFNIKYKLPFNIIIFYFRFLFLKKRKFDTVYIASINNVMIHYILSRISFNSLKTFDDGAANIISSGQFKTYSKSGWIKKLIKFIFFINWSAEKVKKSSKRHFSIYTGLPNIVENVDYIDAFKVADKVFKSEKKESCAILIGSKYTELLKPQADVSIVKKKALSYLKKNEHHTFYLKHPRELEPAEKCIIDSELLSELTVIKLLRYYKEIRLYGFFSSCQINLATNSSIKNFVFNYSKLNEPLKSEFEKGGLIRKLGFEIVDLD